MSIRRVRAPGGPPASGYSPALLVPAGTPLLFLAGHTAMDADGAISGETVAEQFDLALANLLHTLAAGGGAPGQLVRLTIYSVDPEDYRSASGPIGESWRRRVGRAYPAVSLIGVTRLWDARALVELEAVAALPPDAGRTTLPGYEGTQT